MKSVSVGWEERQGRAGGGAATGFRQGGRGKTVCRSRLDDSDDDADEPWTTRVTARTWVCRLCSYSSSLHSFEVR